MKITKRIGAVFLAILVSISVPLLVLAAVITAFWQIFAEWRTIRAGLLGGNLACGIDSDCPLGYGCMDGKCVPIRTE